MITATRVQRIGRGLAYISLLLLALRLAHYLLNEVTLWAGYVGRTLLLVGFLIWFVGTVMAGYTERQHHNSHT
jgi:hypothetical protein